MSHAELIADGWKLIKLVGTPVGLQGIAKGMSYKVYEKNGKTLKVYID